MNKQLPDPTPVFHARMKRVNSPHILMLTLDRWFADESQKFVRLLEVDCQDTQEAKEFTLGWLAEASLPLTQTWPGIWPLVLQSGPMCVQGVLGYLWRKNDGECLNFRLIQEGFGEHVPALQHIQKLTVK